MSITWASAVIERGSIGASNYKQKRCSAARPLRCSAFLARLAQRVWGPDSGSMLAGVQPQQEALPLCDTSPGRGEGARRAHARLTPCPISPVLRQDYERTRHDSSQSFV